MRGYKRRNRPMSMTIRGVVALADWTDMGDDANVVVLTDDDEEFFIDARETSIHPSDFVNARVEATGRVFEQEDRVVLAVRRMRIVESYKDFRETTYEDEEETSFVDDESAFDYLDESNDIEAYSDYLGGGRAYRN